MNILHIGEFDFTRTTGTGSSVLNLSLEQIKNYHKVGIMAPDTSSDKIDFKQILLFNMKTQKYNPFKVYRQDLKRYFISNQILFISMALYCQEIPRLAKYYTKKIFRLLFHLMEP